MRPARRSSRGGFTLIELLTVSGIIVMLATLIMSAAFITQETGRSATCRNNLSQLHKLVMIYTGSYGSYLPAMWHERWTSEMGLSGGQWRDNIYKLRHHPYVETLYARYALYMKKPQSWTDPPSNMGDGDRMYIRTAMKEVYEGRSPLGTISNCDDVNPLIGSMVWNNYQSPNVYTGDIDAIVSTAGQEGRPVYRSGAPFILCPSDISAYRCDQGVLVSYMGLAKYGWWHRGGTSTVDRYFEYHQVQEVPKPSHNILFAETEPGTWQYGGCG